MVFVEFMLDGPFGFFFSFSSDGANIAEILIFPEHHFAAAELASELHCDTR